MRKAAFFIDGFNLYHSLDSRANLKKYKWLNLWEFSKSLLLPNEALAEVNYYTAYTTWNADRMKRHETYVTLNQHVGCSVVLGKFIEKDRYSMVECQTPCLPFQQRFCKKKYLAHEEKMTDVNIAVNIVKAAARHSCESIYLLSGDNDLLPALATALEIAPNIRIRVAIPIHAKAKSLMTFCRQHALKYVRIKEKHLSAAQFSDPILIDGVTYSKPDHWR